MRTHFGIIGCIGQIKHVSGLMGFWRDLIHDVVAVSPFDLKIIITGAACFAITIILNLFFFIFSKAFIRFPSYLRSNVSPYCLLHSRL